MKIVISPAKKLDTTGKYPQMSYSKPIFVDKAEKLIKVMRQKSPEEIKKLMKLSDNLAHLNWKRYQNWQKDITGEARPAIFTFNGNVYDGLDVHTLPNEKLDALNKKLRILSGLYGILRPFDMIYPHRLEMGTKLSFDTYKNLYGFWRDQVTEYLNKELPDGDFLVNLASQEYFKVIDKQELKAPVYEPIFKDYKNGVLKTISIYAKIARGKMTRFIIQNNINTPEELKLFDVDGYRFDDTLSSGNQFVFTR